MPPHNIALAWLGAIVGTYVILFWIAAWWARRTPNDIDDVIVGVVQWPAVLALSLWAAIDLSGRSELPDGVVEVVRRGAGIALIGVVTWCVWRLVRDTVLYYGRRLARRTEANFDDVLFPVLDVLAPVVIIVTGAVLMLRLLGADFSTVVVTAGGAALFLGLSLGDTLKNILGGVMLLVDTPFRFGDLIVIDGVVCQIKQIGLRVTTLYNTESHAEVYLANSILAATKLTNLTRPSPDLKVRVIVPLPDPRLIGPGTELLLALADANPYVLGRPAEKQEAMRRSLQAAEPGSARARELEWGLAALERERELDGYLAEVEQSLTDLLGKVRRAECSGLSVQELRHLMAELNAMHAYPDHLVRAMRAWAQARAADPRLASYPDDRERLLSDAEMRLGALDSRLEGLRKHLHSPDLYQAQRLDDLIVELMEWLPRSFKQITPAWKRPLVQPAHVDLKGVSLQLYVYIDDIHLEGFVREKRVMGELFAEAVEGILALQRREN
ncbi:MAG TPA: mechanosensitive ion channel [Anaerolineae bacterium]|nr:mechanosensitive ion channel [Anaerolineae bacterium]